ncbi:VOC family protein [Allokutzneria sp. NRRL B-24872]|nr:VOC family protein [Allokutzneria sp. NRRL B-24872]
MREPARLCLRGARSELLRERTERWVVLLDPEGNEFCVQ